MKILITFVSLFFVLTNNLSSQDLTLTKGNRIKEISNKAPLNLLGTLDGDRSYYTVSGNVDRVSKDSIFIKVSRYSENVYSNKSRTRYRINYKKDKKIVIGYPKKDIYKISYGKISCFRNSSMTVGSVLAISAVSTLVNGSVLYSREHEKKILKSALVQGITSAVLLSFPKFSLKIDDDDDSKWTIQ